MFRCTLKMKMDEKNSKEIKKEEEAVLIPALNKIYKINKIRTEKIGMKKKENH